MSKGHLSLALVPAAAVLINCSDSTDPDAFVLTVVTSSNGEHIDFNGYQLLIDGAPHGPIGTDDTTTFSQPRDHSKFSQSRLSCMSFLIRSLSSRSAWRSLSGPWA